MHKKKFFNYISNFVARNHWDKTEKVLLPYPYLDIVTSKGQATLLQPTMKGITHGSTMADTVGKSSKKVVASRRRVLIEGNISSYSRLLNSEERLAKVREMNDVVAILTEIQAENADKEAKAKAAKAAKAELERKKIERESKNAEKKAVLLPILPPLVGAIRVNEAAITTIANPRIKKILRHFFNHEGGLSQLARPVLVDALKAHVASYIATTVAV